MELPRTNLDQAMCCARSTLREKTTTSKKASRKSGLEMCFGGSTMCVIGLLLLAGEHVKGPSFRNADPLDRPLKHREQQRNEPQKHQLCAQTAKILTCWSNTMNRTNLERREGNRGEGHLLSPSGGLRRAASGSSAWEPETIHKT